jgi:cyanate permease
MWAVGNVSESIGGFTIPMIAVTVAIVLAAAAGWAATRQAAITRPTALSNQEA